MNPETPNRCWGGGPEGPGGGHPARPWRAADARPLDRVNPDKKRNKRVSYMQTLKLKHLKSEIQKKQHLLQSKVTPGDLMEMVWGLIRIYCLRWCHFCVASFAFKKIFPPQAKENRQEKQKRNRASGGHPGARAPQRGPTARTWTAGAKAAAGTGGERPHRERTSGISDAENERQKEGFFPRLGFQQWIRDVFKSKSGFRCKKI